MKSRLLGVLIIMTISSSSSLGQRHEAAFLSGGLKTGEHEFVLPNPGFVRTGTGLTYQLNYSGRFFDGKVAALYFEFPLVVTPSTKLKPSNVVLPRSYSALFFTPGIKLKLVPGLKWSPYGFVGVGVARLNTSDTSQDGEPVSGDSRVKAAYDFGGGIDVKVFSHVSLRGEVRDFYSGTPQFDVSLLKDRQHNFLISAGVVVRF
jgi:opacity protein-like surface antigen